MQNFKIIIFSIKKIIKKSYKSIKLKFHILFFNHNYFSNVYINWKEAELNSNGYDSNLILEKCKISQLKVLNGEAAYERDSVIFFEKSFHWQLICTIQLLALKNKNEISVLDFGGSLGTLYYQNRSFLNFNTKINWMIVEQENFVKCGNNYFANNELKFYPSIKDATSQNTPDLVILSSVIQYIELPEDLIKNILNYKPMYILIDRTPNTNITNNIITIQKVPKNIYHVSYPCWIFSKNSFLKMFTDYSLISEFNTNITKDFYFKNKLINWNGFLFKKNL